MVTPTRTWEPERTSGLEASFSHRNVVFCRFCSQISLAKGNSKGALYHAWKNSPDSRNVALSISTFSFRLLKPSSALMCDCKCVSEQMLLCDASICERRTYISMGGGSGRAFCFNDLSASVRSIKLVTKRAFKITKTK